MRYKKFIIKNFKGINDLTIDLSKQPESHIYTFVGLNESGKTTILEAINTINTGYNPLTSHRLIPKHLKANFNGNVSVKAYIEIDDTDNIKIGQKIEELGYNGYKKINEFTIESTCSFKDSKYVKSISYWDFHPTVKKNNSKHYIQLEHQDDCEDDWLIIANYIEKNLMPQIVYY